MKIQPFKAAFGFLALFFSVILLLSTANIVSWGIWLFVWQFWPAIFVVFGMAFLMYRWKLNFFLGMASFALLFALIGAGLWITWQDQYFNTQKFAEVNGKNITETKITDEMPRNREIDGADVKFRLGESDLKINSLKEDEQGFLFDGTHISNFFTLNQRLELVGEKVKLNFRTSPFVNRIFGPKNINEINLGFSEAPNYSFDLETGSSNIDLNFEHLKVKNLGIDTAASNVAIHFSETADTKVDIKSGASTIKLYLPQTLGIKINSETALTSRNFGSFNMVKTQHGWQSANWDKAKNRVEIKLESGVSKIELAK